MYPTHYLDRRWELIKWAALLTLAASLVMALASTASGQNGPSGGHVPADPNRSSRGTVDQPQLMRFPQIFVPGQEEDLRPLPEKGILSGNPFNANWLSQLDQCERVWEILTAHLDNQHDRALSGWQSMELSEDAESWRYVAMGAAHLNELRIREAAAALDAACRRAPDNSVAHYFAGLMRLEQAAMARQWNDAIGPEKTRLVSQVPLMVHPNTRSMFKIAAIVEFEKAIEMSAHLERDKPLATYGASCEGLPPTVDDLLVALGADQFVGDSHNIVGGLCLEMGSAERAEGHLDAAAALGVDVLDGYRDLGDLFEDEERHLDAARAYTKSLRYGPGVVQPTKKVVENLRRALLDMW